MYNHYNETKHSQHVRQTRMQDAEQYRLVQEAKLAQKPVTRRTRVMRAIILSLLRMITTVAGK